MRILHVGNLHDFQSAKAFSRTPQRLLNGFTRLGHTVYSLNDRNYARYASIFRSREHGKKFVDAQLLKICADYEPDLVILANCEMVTNEAVLKLKDRFKSTKVAYRNIDSLFQGGNLEKIQRRYDVADAIFITTHPSELAYQGKTTLAFLPNVLDLSLDTGRAFDLPNGALDHDLFYAGHFVDDMSDGRPAFLAELQQRLGHRRLGFFGSAVKKPAIEGMDYIRALAKSKMGLSLDREDKHRLYASERMAHYLGNGLLTLVKSGKGFEEFFDENELAWFSNAETAAEQVERFSKDDAARRRVAEAGWKKAHRLFPVEKVAGYMLDVSFDRLDPKDMRWDL